MAISTIANPALNETSNTKPSPTRRNAIAPSSKISADSHGTSPPLAPNATNPPHEISSGTWVWPPGP